MAIISSIPYCNYFNPINNAVCSVLLWKQGSRIIFAGEIKVRRDERFAKGFAQSTAQSDSLKDYIKEWPPIHPAAFNRFLIGNLHLSVIVVFCFEVFDLFKRIQFQFNNKTNKQ